MRKSVRVRSYAEASDRYLDSSEMDPVVQVQRRRKPKERRKKNARIKKRMKPSWRL